MKRALLALAAVSTLAVGGCASEADATPTTPTTPQSCLDALDAADHLNSLTEQGFRIVAHTLGAASEFDSAGIDADTTKIEKLTPKVGAAVDAYRTARDDCRGSETS